ncbi:MAG: ATP-binding protein [Bacteroidales bacterium]|nr:ATP-binding protein [Bacteroidales bacterium]
MIKIYLEGAESTGKSSLAFNLAQIFNADYLPEYGRLYVEYFYGKFGYIDIETIAETQLLLENAYESNGTQLLFIDTSLINTKQWFLYDYKKYPKWLDNEIKKYSDSLFLLCDTDLNWIEDGIRTNSGQSRLDLQKKYKNCLIENKIQFHTISGKNQHRINLAKKFVEQYLASTKEYA